MPRNLILGVAAGLTVIALLILIIIGVRWAFSPALPWYRITGMPFPGGASVAMAGTSKSGARWIVLRVNGTAIQQLLGKPPPLGQGAWLPGPVDLAIVAHLQFDSELWGLLRSQTSNKTKFLGGSDAVWKMLDSKSIFYAAMPEAGGANPSDPWAKGRILIIDPTNGRLWANAWDRSGF
jgi:hypothetical protein